MRPLTIAPLSRIAGWAARWGAEVIETIDAADSVWDGLPDDDPPVPARRYR